MNKLNTQKENAPIYDEKQCGFSWEEARIAGESFERVFRKKLNKKVLKSFFIKTR